MPDRISRVHFIQQVDIVFISIHVINGAFLLEGEGGKLVVVLLFWRSLNRINESALENGLLYIVDNN